MGKATVYINKEGFDTLIPNEVKEIVLNYVQVLLIWMKNIKSIVTSESIFICISSWCLSILVGVPVTFAGSYLLGFATIKLPLQLSAAYFVLPYAIWLVLTVIVGYTASKKSAKRAACFLLSEKQKEWNMNGR